MERLRGSINRSFALFPVLVLITMIAGGNIIAFRSTNRLFEERSVERSLGETAVVHRFIEVAQRKALESYLKGFAEDLKFSLEAINGMVSRGEISAERGMESIFVTLDSRRIGRSGYVYILDSEGFVLFHPDAEVVGTTLDDHEPVRRRLKQSDGYFEYLWANPNEISKRRKAAYSIRFEPLGWTVVVSAYVKDFPDLVVLDDLRGFLGALSDADIATYILDESGRFLIHPELEGSDIGELPEWKELADDLEEDSDYGTLALPLGERGRSGRNYKTIRYSRLRDFGWIVVSEIDASSTRELLRETLIVQLIATAGLIALVGLVLLGFGRFFSKPVMDLHTTFVESLVPEDAFSERRDSAGFAGRLLSYRRQLEGDRKVLGAMARFVSDSPMPILRIRRDWSCSFSNTAADRAIAPHLLDEFRYVDMDLRETLEHCLTGPSTSIVTMADRRYLTSSTGDWREGEAYLAFLDITDSSRYETLWSIWRSVMAHSTEAIVIVDDAGRIQRINGSFTRITGYGETEAVGSSLESLLDSGLHDEEFYESIVSVIYEEGLWEGEVWNRRKNGEIFPSLFSIASIDEFGTEHRRFIVVFRDVSLVKNQEKTIRRMRSSDRLTNLPNRGTFYENLSERLSAVRVGKDRVAVVLVDVDNFSLINHTFGTGTGDFLLKAIAGILKRNIRECDMAARIDGDEFGILLDAPLGNDAALEVTDRICESLQEGVEIEGRMIRFTVSGGVVYSPYHGRTADELVANANTALRRAKKEAVGTFLYFEGIKDAHESFTFELELALRESLSKGEMFLQFQPIVSGEDGRAASFEALVRWRRSDGTIVPPDRFIPVAENTGFIIPLGKWVIRECCGMIAGFPPEEAPVVAANVSARQFADENFFGDLSAIVESSGIPADRLALEITENIAAVDVGETIRLLNDIADAGHSVSIDDFGTGYSSLKYIRDFSFEKLKVDKSFIDALGVDPGKQAIVEAIVSMGHSLGKKIIAEGVETEEQMRMLRDLGCDYMQGYLYSKPMDRSEAVEYWKRNSGRFLPS